MEHYNGISKGDQTMTWFMAYGNCTVVIDVNVLVTVDVKVAIGVIV